MSALSTNAASFTCGAADNDEGGEKFHVEHHGGHTNQRVELGRYAAGSDEERILFGHGWTAWSESPMSQPRGVAVHTSSSVGSSTTAIRR
jgi:hypothetical protein